MNPFSDYGNVITSERYVFRNLENEIKKFLNGGIISIVGLPRVGKTSMIEHIFKDEVNYFKINFGMIENATEFFETMIEELYSKLSENQEIEKFYERSLKRSNKKLAFKSFYVSVSKLIDKFFIFIDEFDYAEKILSRSDLEVIREIFSQNKSTKDIFNLILVSRRKIFEIEGAANSAGSTLQGVLIEKFLKPYEGEEIARYFSYLSKYILVNEDLKKEYKVYTGFHPYLSDIISYNLVEHKKSIKEIFLDNKIVFYDYFSHIYKILEEKDLFDVLLSIIFDLPFYEEHKVDILGNYGIIDEKYEVFCDTFLEYCKEKFEITDFYNIWYKTENALRNIIKTVLLKNYKNFKEIENKYNEKKFLKNALFYLKSQNRSKYSVEKSNNFIDGLSTSGIFHIILNEWYFFEGVFGDSKEYWEKIFNDIKDIRNLLSHTKKVDKKTITKLNLYCENILEKIDNYYKKNV